MKHLVVLVIRWGMPGAIALIFLVLPDLVQSDAAPPGWIVRVFYVVFLSNSFFGTANAFNNSLTVKGDVDKYRHVDKDTLIISYILGHSLYSIGATCFLFNGLATLYPSIGWWKYSFAVFYGILISIMHYIVCKMQIHYVKERV